MELLELHQAKVKASYGGKINGLIHLIQAGFLVPRGLILSAEISLRLLELLRLDASQHLTDSRHRFLLKEMIQSLESFMDEGKSYIVRSSSFLEDGQDSSFAGQYESINGCQTVDQILQAIEQCLMTAGSHKVKAYQKNQVSSHHVNNLALLIQEEVGADFSGVSFGVDPVSQKDRSWSLEYVQGGGAPLVSGHHQPFAVSSSWDASVDLEGQLLDAALLNRLRADTLLISEIMQCPMDIEFCLVGQDLYYVQARPITRFNPRVSKGRWTTANFRDGGVAAQSCPALMASLYQHSWQLALEDFLTHHQLLSADQVEELMLLHYGRPYWNLGIVKTAMEQIPGYVESEFDSELGVAKDYEGKGVVSKFSLKSVGHLIKVAFALNRTSKNWLETAQTRKDKLLNLYHNLEVALNQPQDQAGLETIWRDLVTKAYLRSETTYFKQVFINTVQLSLKKNRLLKRISQEDFFDLISALGNLSHTQVDRALYQIAQTILSNQLLRKEWESLSIDQLLAKSSEERLDMTLIRQFLADYGYHSKRELYLLEPSFSEDSSFIFDSIQQMVLKPQQPSFEKSGLRHRQELIREEVGSFHYRRLYKDIRFLRDLLWWREEFKDISTRYYHLIRQWTLSLGKCYEEQGLISCAEDLFYLSWQDILAFMDGQLGSDHLTEKAAKNRQYCRIYDKAVVPGDLFETRRGRIQEKESETELQGLVASGGFVTARVRVLTDMNDLGQIEAGEILVTPFTDTGWSPIFSRLSGLVTETGGVLCHASIVAREYGIPTLVCVENACQRLRTGMLVTIDSDQGRLIIEEE